MPNWTTTFFFFRKKKNRRRFNFINVCTKIVIHFAFYNRITNQHRTYLIRRNRTHWLYLYLLTCKRIFDYIFISFVCARVVVVVFFFRNLTLENINWTDRGISFSNNFVCYLCRWQILNAVRSYCVQFVVSAQCSAVYSGLLQFWYGLEYCYFCCWIIFMVWGFHTFNAIFNVVRLRMSSNRCWINWIDVHAELLWKSHRMEWNCP